MNERCKYEKSCGSCQFLNVPYAEQLATKTQIVANNLKGIDCQVLPTIGSFYPYKYRNKLHLAFGRQREKINIGFYREDSKDVVNIEDCILHADWAGKLIAILRKYIAKSRIEIFDEESQTGNLRYAVARVLDGSLMLTLVIYQKFIIGLDYLYGDLKEEFKEVGIYLNINQTKTSAVFSNIFMHKKGIKKLDAKMLGVHFQLTPQTFYQVNQSIATKIYTQALNLIQAKKGQIVLDLYSGIGISTLLLAKSGAKIISIEVVPESVTEAKRLAHANNIKNVTFLCGKCEDILPTLAVENLQQEAYIAANEATQDGTLAKSEMSIKKEVTAFLDPPRKGCGEVALTALLKFSPAKIIYLSCNTASLAQDLAYLTPHYTVSYIQPYDMFSQTKHIETLCCLIKK